MMGAMSNYKYSFQLKLYEELLSSKTVSFFGTTSHLRLFLSEFELLSHLFTKPQTAIRQSF